MCVCVYYLSRERARLSREGGPHLTVMQYALGQPLVGHIGDADTRIVTLPARDTPR